MHSHHVRQQVIPAEYQLVRSPSTIVRIASAVSSHPPPDLCCVVHSKSSGSDESAASGATMAGQPVTNPYSFNATSSSAALTAGLVSAFGQPYVNARSAKINSTAGTSIAGGPGCTSKPTRITDQDAIQLLAEDVESRLEALLRTFIQEEKLRQQARQQHLTMGRRSLSLTSLNACTDLSPTTDTLDAPVDQHSCSHSHHHHSQHHHQPQQQLHHHSQQSHNNQWNTIGPSNHWSSLSPASSVSTCSSASSSASSTSQSTNSKSFGQLSPNNRSSSTTPTAHVHSSSANSLHHQHQPQHHNHHHHSHRNAMLTAQSHTNPIGGSCNSLNTIGLSGPSNSTLANFIQHYPHVNTGTRHDHSSTARHSSHRLGGGGTVGVVASAPTSNQGSARRSASVDKISSTSTATARSVSPSPPARQHSTTANLYSNKTKSGNTTATTKAAASNTNPLSSSPIGSYTKNLFGSPRSSASETAVSSKSNRSRSASPHSASTINSLSSHLIQQLAGNGPCSTAKLNGCATPVSKTMTNGSVVKKASSPNVPSSTVVGSSTPTPTPRTGHSLTASQSTTQSSQTVPQSTQINNEPLSRRVAAAREQEQKRIRTPTRSSSVSDANNNLITSNEKMTEARRRSLADGCASYSVVSDTKHKWEQREQQHQQQHHQHHHYGMLFEPEVINPFDFNYLPHPYHLGHHQYLQFTDSHSNFLPVAR